MEISIFPTATWQLRYFRRTRLLLWNCPPALLWPHPRWLLLGNFFQFSITSWTRAPPSSILSSLSTLPPIQLYSFLALTKFQSTLEFNSQLYRFQSCAVAATTTTVGAAPWASSSAFPSPSSPSSSPSSASSSGSSGNSLSLSNYLDRASGFRESSNLMLPIGRINGIKFLVIIRRI